MGRYVVLGGTRSGKSRHAERRAGGLADGAPVEYVATGHASDDELAERIGTHRRRRPAHWRTHATRDIGAVLDQLPDAATVLVDDLEGWLTDRMTAEGLWTDAAVAPWGADGDAARRRILAEAADWWARAGARTGATVVTAGQPGTGVTPPSASVRRWLDLHGELLQLLGADADAVELVVAGRPLPLPPAEDRAPEPLPSPSPDPPADADLREHGDTQVPAGAVDLAVNVLPGPPEWLRERVAAATEDLASYPDAGDATAAAAARHGRPVAECAPLHGAAEAFFLLAHALRPRAAVCVHPSFTEAEAALRAAGTPVTRMFREPQRWELDPADVPAHADLVVLGRPDNPTGVADPPEIVARLCRPGRTVVVDEAFAEFLPDGDGLAHRRDLPGLVVLRSLTKLWGLAGLRVGYLLAEASVVSRLAAARQPWPLSTPALAALAACTDPAAEAERRRRATDVAHAREDLHGRLTVVAAEVGDLRVWPSAANFLLLRGDVPHGAQADLRTALLADGLAVRRGDTFPGLDARYVRTAVTDDATGQRLAAALRRHLSPPEEAP